MLPESQNAVFFNEGHGYLFVKTLGQGQFGCASLVRSLHNGRLYVRKEELRLSEVYSDHQARTQPSREAQLALKVKDIQNVYKLKGWVRHFSSAESKALEVSYWSLCNLGSMNGVYDAARKYGHRLPEPLLCQWLGSMLKTTIQVQQAGIIHRDGHEGNWLLHAENGRVKVILGDFGCAKLREECTQQQWLSGCRSDFANILQIMCLLCGFTDKGTPISMSQVSSYRRERYSCGFMQVLDVLEAIVQTRPRSTTYLHEQISHCIAMLAQVNRPVDLARLSYLRPTVPKLEFAPYEHARGVIAKNRASFKNWNIATVSSEYPGRASSIKVLGMPREFHDKYYRKEWGSIYQKFEH